ncbi:MAG: PAS domain S-box protein, partial [Spirochaetota bacterium]
MIQNKDHTEIFENAPFGCASIRMEQTRDGNAKKCILNAVNPALESITGHPAAELVGVSLAGLPDEVRILFPCDGDIFRMYDEDGTFSYDVQQNSTAVSYKVTVYAAGESEAVCMFTDITEWEHTRKELQRKSEQYELALSGSNDGIWDWNIETGELFLSPKWKEQLGYTDDELPNVFDTFESNLHPDDRTHVMETVSRYFNGEQTQYDILFRMRHKNGSYRHISSRGAALRDDSGKACRMVGYHTDITEQVQYRNLLQKSEERFRSYVENANDIIFTMSLDGTFEYLSPNCSEIIGYTADDLVGRNISFVLHPDDVDPCFAFIQEIAISGEKRRGIEYRLRHRNGRFLWHSSTGSPLHDNGNVISILGISHDISKLKETELILTTTNRYLQEATVKAKAASKAKTEFVSTMSHEIRTPLNGVIGFAQILAETTLNDVQREYVRNINSAAITLMDVINDVLDFSKIEAGYLELDPESTDVAALVERSVDVVSYQAAQKGIELLVSVDPSMPTHAVVDLLRLKQVLSNLLGNAVKFTQSGEIELSVRYDHRESAMCAYTFTVRDTGIGIDQAVQQKLFSPFTQKDSSITRSYGGTGLGLAISQMLVQKMGGSISLDSTPGLGSSFSFTVTAPVSDETRQYWKSSVPRRCLVIDDNTSCREILKQYLSMCNVEYAGTDTALEAIKMIETSAPFDLIIADYHMPYIDGLDTIRMVREKCATHPGKPDVILLHSVNDAQDLHARCAMLNIFRKMPKPVRFSELNAVLAELFGGVTLPNPNITADVVRADEKPAVLQSGEGKRILVVEDDMMNMLVVKTLVSRAIPGIHIVEALNGKEALEHFENGHFDLVLLDLHMPVMGGKEAASLMRKHEEAAER